MRRMMAVFSLLVLVGYVSADAKGTEVDLGGFKSTAPAEWKSEKPSSGMRFLQFALPKVGEDKTDAAVVVFKGMGGTDEQNIDRWKGMFTPPEGKKMDDVAKVTTVKVGDTNVTFLNIHGTYSERARPMDPKSDMVKHNDYRMVAVIFKPKDEVFHIRLLGPNKTVEKYQKGFEDWVKGFKK